MSITRFVAALLVLAQLVLSAQAQTPTTEDPGQLGFAIDRLQRIDLMLQRLVADNEISGAVILLARDGRIGHFVSVGNANLEEDLPMRSDTIFRLASMTKPIVSVGAMILFEEGRFQLTDPVSQYIPEFADVRVLEVDKGTLRQPSREITIQDLLRHTSGMAYAGESTIVDAYYVNAKLDDPSRTLEEMVLKISELPLAFSPGEGWVYGRSTEVLGHLIERIADEPLDSFLHDRVLEPLKMIDTGFFVPREKAHRFAMAYLRTDEGDLRVSEYPIGKWLDRPKLLVPGAGMVSTAPDYFRFSQMLLNGGELDGVRILSPTTVDLMVRNHLRVEILPTEFGGPTWDWMVRGWGFGLGFRVLVDAVIAGSAASHGSYGWFGCNNTFFLIDPRERLIGIFMAQSATCDYPGVREFQSLMHQALEK